MWISESGEFLGDDPDERPDPSHKARFVDSFVPALDQYRYAAQQDHTWVPGYVCETLVSITARRKAAKDQCARILKDLDSEEQHLHYCWDGHAKKQFLEDLAAQKGKKRSVNYAMGVCGLTKSRAKIEVVDELLAVAFLAKKHANAIKTKLSVIKDSLPACDVPGVVRHPGGEDVFYARGARGGGG